MGANPIWHWAYFLIQSKKLSILRAKKKKSGDFLRRINHPWTFQLKSLLKNKPKNRWPKN